MQASQADIDRACDDLMGTMHAPRGTDPAQLLRSYAVAFEGFSVTVVETVVRRVLRGEFEGLNARYLPTGPEISQLCRKVEGEIARSAAFKSYSFPTPEALSPFERRVARLKEELASWRLVDEAVSLDEFGRNCKRLKYPVGSKWVPMLNGNVYAPPKETGQGNGQASSTGEEGVGSEA